MVPDHTSPWRATGALRELEANAQSCGGKQTLRMLGRASVIGDERKNKRKESSASGSQKLLVDVFLLFVFRIVWKESSLATAALFAESWRLRE